MKYKRGSSLASIPFAMDGAGLKAQWCAALVTIGFVLLISAYNATKGSQRFSWYQGNPRAVFQTFAKFATSGASETNPEVHNTLIPTEWSEQIDSDIRPFLERRISRANLDTACTLNPYLMRVLIINNTLYRHHTCWLVAWKDDPQKKLVVEDLLLPLLRVLCVAQVPDVELVLNYGDESAVFSDSTNQVPVFSWSKATSDKDILIPYFTFAWVPWGENSEVKPLLTDERWQSKKDLAVWRGSTTGGVYRKDNWRNLTRSILVKKCQERPDLCDAAMMSCVQCDEDAREEIKQELHMEQAQFLNEQEVLGFKYMLMVDGNSAPSSRSRTAFEGDSLIFFQETEFREFFYTSLRPYKHYLPLAHDLDDLYSRIEWARSHDLHAKEMVRNGQLFARKYFTAEMVSGYYEELLRKYAKALDYEPNWIPDYEVDELKLEGERHDRFKSYMGTRCQFSNLTR